MRTSSWLRWMRRPSGPVVASRAPQKAQRTGSPTVTGSGCRSLGAGCRCITRGASDEATRLWSTGSRFFVDCFGDGYLRGTQRVVGGRWSASPVDRDRFLTPTAEAQDAAVVVAGGVDSLSTISATAIYADPDVVLTPRPGGTPRPSVNRCQDLFHRGPAVATREAEPAGPTSCSAATAGTPGLPRAPRLRPCRPVPRRCRHQRPHR